VANVELPTLTKPTLEDAIRALREPTPATLELEVGVLRKRCADVANDLAMLHGLIEAREAEYVDGLIEWREQETAGEAEYRTAEYEDEDRVAECVALNDIDNVVQLHPRGPWYPEREYEPS
jgi:hypothetical protein